MFVRGTKAVNMLLGVLIFFGLAFLARLLNLVVVSWIFESFIKNVFIVLLILFHPEIRRVLLKFGRNEWVRLFLGERKEIYSVLEKVVKHFSQNKVGALFVLQRFSGMQSVLETGVKLYAHASVELFKTIYYEEGPLHDGAVLIKNNTIVAAGCFLPLSEGSNLAHSYGTRHRAALGASEEFDCVVIVVSAESGNVSIAYDGSLKKSSPTTVINRVIELMKTKNPIETKAKNESTKAKKEDAKAKRTTNK
jgi:diadenylate cyclase